MTKETMRKIYDSKVFWIIVSVIASLIMWVFVTDEQSDEFKTSFRGVPLELSGQSTLKDSKELVVTGLSTNTVTLEITGPRRIVASLSSDDLQAVIDVSKLSQAAFASMTYSVRFPSGIDTSKLTVIRKIPETVSFSVSTLNKKTIPVRGSFDGSTADGYTAEPVVFEPASIEVSGADTYLKDISYAWVSFGESNVSSTYSVEANFVLMREDGTPANTEGVTCSTDIVKATLPILELKDVQLSVNVVYGAGANENNTKITVDPTSVTLAGDSSILSGLNKIVLATIDLTDFESNFKGNFPITIDNTLTNVEGVTEASVNVEVVGLETKVFKTTSIEVINVSKGFKSEVISKSLDVTLRGAADDLNAINPEAVRAVADLVDYDATTGTHNVPVKIYVDGSDKVGAIGDYTISVKLEG